MKVKCTFCGNTFYAPPKEAICPKCDRPANRPLKPLLRVICLLLPPLGLIYALVVRPSSPVAGMQGLLFSIVGFLIYGAIYAARAQFQLF